MTAYRIRRPSQAGARPAIPMTVAWGLGLALCTALISGVSVWVNSYGVKTVPDAALYTTLKNGVAAAILLGALAFLRPGDRRHEARALHLGGMIDTVGLEVAVQRRVDLTQPRRLVGDDAARKFGKRRRVATEGQRVCQESEQENAERVHIRARVDTARPREHLLGAHEGESPHEPSWIHGDC